MNSLLKLTPVMAALAFTLACSDDEDNDDNNNRAGRGGEAPTGGTSGTGGGGGSSGADGAGECKGIYTGWTAAELAAEVGEGACAPDTAAVCGADLSAEVGTCGSACFTSNPGDEPGQLDCTVECVNREVEDVPGDACLACYIAAVACARENCATECVSAPGSDECVDCRNESGCTAAFFACSGLPLPSARPDAGEGGAASM